MQCKYHKTTISWDKLKYCNEYEKISIYHKESRHSARLVYLSSLLAGWLACWMVSERKNSFLVNNCNKEEIIAMKGKKSDGMFSSWHQ
jgi:hypothetical protein